MTSAPSRSSIASRGLIAAFALLMATGAVAVAAQENVAGTWNGTFSRGEFKEGFTMMLAGQTGTANNAPKVVSARAK
jgi:hypothetical protein